MAKKYKLSYLSNDFYNKYISSEYSEIESKVTRPYLFYLSKLTKTHLLFLLEQLYKHEFCCRFKNSNRDTNTVTGLDYTKAVIVNDDLYIRNDATIDNKEYVELNSKFYFIISQFKKYVYWYYKYINGELNEFEEKRYKYSTLKYFHKELGIGS